MPLNAKYWPKIPKPLLIWSPQWVWSTPCGRNGNEWADQMNRCAIADIITAAEIITAADIIFIADVIFISDFITFAITSAFACSNIYDNIIVAIILLKLLLYLLLIIQYNWCIYVCSYICHIYHIWSVGLIMSADHVGGFASGWVASP